MQKLFDEVGFLDQRCYEKFGLSEDLLMEHAANGMAEFIRCKFEKDSKIIVVCGSGNNGADGIALARLLHGDFDVSIFYAKKPKSPMASEQEKRAKAIGVKECTKLYECDAIVDAIVGTGFRGDFDTDTLELLNAMNTLDAFKIACDVPSGLNKNGVCAEGTFVADISFTMGALKKSLFLDEAKDFVGEVRVLDLGISRSVYETNSNWHLLDLEDINLPARERKNSHKGSFGHLAIASGEKIGASIISGLSAFKFGAGLVTLVGYENEQTLNIPYTLMYSHKLPSNTTALACGMGLGMEFSDSELSEFLDNTLPLVIDADIFHMNFIKEILKRENLVLTPHPKEFVSLLKQLNLADISVEELQKNRFHYVEIFCEKFPHCVLLLKGANVIIGEGSEFFINSHGSAKLAKGGSGDVLSGLIGSLLAQGYKPLEATQTASLVHTKLALNYTGSDFSLTPDDLIGQIGNL